ncbi:hypothetical protein [Mesorhizobium sp.]|uniref:hypothetical protein n=1 Tax=Mesorhizobium sp. TaxID=1871066 RepID=UPI001220AF08|nr:hypothetical protein [Mesorhizobium sp.]TIO62970.1 MAG: hypothetical protein E5X79_01490 [Mesorhizobium sp.]
MKTLAAHGQDAPLRFAASDGIVVSAPVAGLLQAVALADGVSVERLILDLVTARAEAIGLDILAQSVRDSEAGQ